MNSNSGIFIDGRQVVEAPVEPRRINLRVKVNRYGIDKMAVGDSVEIPFSDFPDRPERAFWRIYNHARRYEGATFQVERLDDAARVTRVS